LVGNLKDDWKDQSEIGPEIAMEMATSDEMSQDEDKLHQHFDRTS
jgi:hypothetical protein